MAKRAKRRGTPCAGEEARPERANAGLGLAVPQDLVMLAELLAPDRVETLRRQLIDGTARDIEPFLYKFAYSGPLEPEAERRSVRFMTWEGWEAEQTGQTPPDRPKAVDQNKRRASTAGSDLRGGYRIKWDRVVLDLRRRARALVEDPRYLESLRRRLIDGKAPRMMRLLLQWPDKKARDPEEQGRGKPPLTVVMDHLPGTYDPLAERQKAMIAALEADEALQARAREEARTKQATAEAAPPDDSSDGEELELYEEPEPSPRNSVPKGWV